jgi:hypothetical protein
LDLYLNSKREINQIDQFRIENRLESEKEIIKRPKRINKNQN